MQQGQSVPQADYNTRSAQYAPYRKSTDSVIPVSYTHLLRGILSCLLSLVVLMTDEPSKIAAVMKIARKTIGIANQNIVFALGVGST